MIRPLSSLIGSLVLGSASLWLVSLLLPSPSLAQTFSGVQVGPTGTTPAIRLAAPASSAAVGVEEEVTADGATEADATEETAENSKSTEDAEAAKKLNEEAQKAAARLKKFKAATYDRLPASILREWAKRPGEDKDPEDDNETKEEGTKPSEAEEKKPEPDPLDAEIKQLQRDVTLGNWPQVKEYLATLSEKEGEAAYAQMIKSLATAPKGVGPKLPPELSPELKAELTALLRSSNSRQIAKLQDHNQFSLDDVMALIDLAPCDLEKEMTTNLGLILRLVLQDGNAIESAMVLLEEATAKPEDVATLSRRQAVQLLVAAGEMIRAGQFLPTVEEAKEQKDHEALNLLSRFYLAKHTEENETKFLDQAWQVNQAVFALGEVEKEERDEALRRAVELAPKVRDEFGQKWLDESFTEEPRRGMEIIAAIGTAAVGSFQSQAKNPDVRLRLIQLQTTAVEALLKASEQRAADWKEMLNLLAMNWLREATMSYELDQSGNSAGQLQRDMYGNYFYANSMVYPPRPSSGGPQPIPAIKLVETMPGNTWLGLLDESLRPQFDMIFAQLYLKIDEEDKAFPFIERLADRYPKKGKDLVDEFLRVWTKNHDPNASRNRTNYYMFMYGYERKAESIPLTRSKQQRNLEELAQLVKRLQALPLDDLDEKLLARAFTTCHSSAEVYRIEAIESVFGAVDKLAPETLAELAQQMRANLIGVWRQPAVQNQNKTKRKQSDIQAEVLRGYSVAKEVLKDGLEKHPGHWALELAGAALDHDENNYRQELAKSSEFSQRRSQSFAGFQKAAKAYADQVEKLDEEDETTTAFELWYYASLGACDLQHVGEDSVPDLKQAKLIREAILALPAKAAERHMAMFANSLFTRMSAVNPASKHRYLVGGFEIVGDHKQAREAKKVFTYYKDLITEIKLEAVIDGSDVVGHERPFGLFINLRHTREIERESGGFGRYLQNQNAGQSYFYNYGRPTEDYRDKFEGIVNDALSEHFEVLSVTFQKDDVSSKAIAEYGWRITPYAYVLLKARGPEVDRIPPVRLDLDFLDTSGYVIIPVETPAVAIDASGSKGDTRPVQNLNIAQTLDERQADEGKLVLEIKASGQGLVPRFDELFQLDPGKFDIVETADEGLSISKFDEESEENVVVSERSWMVTMRAKEELKELPKTFRFAKPMLPTKEVVFQRYVDADLMIVENQISLEQTYGEVSYTWAWGLVIGCTMILVVGVVGWRVARQSTDTLVEKRFQVPDDITPFTVIGVLRNIQSNNGLDDGGRRALETSISQVEQFYFSKASDDEPDLHAIVHSWIERTS